MRDLHSGSKSSSNVAAVSSPTQTKQEVVFGKTPLTPKSSIPTSSDNNANGTQKKPQVHTEILNEEIHFRKLVQYEISIDTF